MILLKKAVRSVWRGRRSYLACIALMALGVMLFVALNTLYVNLDNAMRVMYREQRFADGFVRLRKSRSLYLPRLEAFDGVERVQGSLTADARVEGLPKRARLSRCGSAPLIPRTAGGLNDFLLTQGKLPARDGELLLGEPS